MQTFDIYFLGEMLPDADPAAVRRDVAKLFKTSDDAVDKLFSGKPRRVKQGIDVDTASRYRAAFREAGALLQIVPTGGPPPEAISPESAAGTKTQPEGTTSGPAKAATGDIGLAEPGAIIDNSQPPPPVEIDISSLSAAPPNSGSLEDCKVEKPPHPIPDISHLDIVDD